MIDDGGKLCLSLSEGSGFSKDKRLATRRFLSGHDNAVIPSYPHRCRLLGLNSIKTRHSHLQACFIASVILNELKW